MRTLIGKEYIPVDNSWSVNVTLCGDILRSAKTSYLAGTYRTPPKKCIIVSDPFFCNTQTTGISKPKEIKEMIMVEYNDETHMVLYNPEGVL